MITAKLAVNAGKVTPNAQINPLLGQNGIPVDAFCKLATEKIKNYEEGQMIRLVIKKKQKTEDNIASKEFELYVKGPARREILEKSILQLKKIGKCVTLEQIYAMAQSYEPKSEKEIIEICSGLISKARQLKIRIILSEI